MPNLITNSIRWIEKHISQFQAWVLLYYPRIWEKNYPKKALILLMIIVGLWGFIALIFLADKLFYAGNWNAWDISATFFSAMGGLGLIVAVFINYFEFTILKFIDWVKALKQIPRKFDLNQERLILVFNFVLYFIMYLVILLFFGALFGLNQRGIEKRIDLFIIGDYVSADAKGEVGDLIQYSDKLRDDFIENLPNKLQKKYSNERIKKLCSRLNDEKIDSSKLYESFISALTFNYKRPMLSREGADKAFQPSDGKEIQNRIQAARFFNELYEYECYPAIPLFVRILLLISLVLCLTYDYFYLEMDQFNSVIGNAILSGLSFLMKPDKPFLMLVTWSCTLFVLMALFDFNTFKELFPAGWQAGLDSIGNKRRQVGAFCYEHANSILGGVFVLFLIIYFKEFPMLRKLILRKEMMPKRS